MKKYIIYSAMVLFTAFAATPLIAIAAPSQQAYAAPAADPCNKRVLGMPTWYRGVASGKDCELEMPTGLDGTGEFIWKIALNVIEMVLVIIVYISVGFTIYAGFLFMTGGSNPSTITQARSTITNALIGLVIGMLAIGIVNFIFGRIF